MFTYHIYSVLNSINTSPIIQYHVRPTTRTVDVLGRLYYARTLNTSLRLRLLLISTLQSSPLCLSTPLIRILQFLFPRAPLPTSSPSFTFPRPSVLGSGAKPCVCGDSHCWRWGRGAGGFFAPILAHFSAGNKCRNA